MALFPTQQDSLLFTIPMEKLFSYSKVWSSFPYSNRPALFLISDSMPYFPIPSQKDFTPYLRAKTSIPFYCLVALSPTTGKCCPHKLVLFSSTCFAHSPISMPRLFAFPNPYSWIASLWFQIHFHWFFVCLSPNYFLWYVYEFLSLTGSPPITQSRILFKLTT